MTSKLPELGWTLTAWLGKFKLFTLEKKPTYVPPTGYSPTLPEPKKNQAHAI